MSNKACRHRQELYSASGITGSATGGYVNIPASAARYYLKLTATEDSAGSITVEVKGNESKSTTNAFTLDNFGGAILVTGVTRTEDGSTSGQELLSPYLYVDLSSVTGEWTILVELWYSKVDVS